MDNKNGPPQQSLAAHFLFQVGSYILIGDTGGDGEVRIDGVESEGYACRQRDGDYFRRCG
jgi:hypothetical protein